MRRGIGALAMLPALLALTQCTHTNRPAEPQRARRTEKPGNDDSPGAAIDPMGPNAGCYVCHQMFVRELISRVHLAGQIGCVDCHGPSAAHANDEDIGATSPDITYAADAVDAFCRDCHPEHDVAPALVIRRWKAVEPDGEKETVSTTAARCTVCHGEHRIAATSNDPDAEGNGT